MQYTAREDQVEVVLYGTSSFPAKPSLGRCLRVVTLLCGSMRPKCGYYVYCF